MKKILIISIAMLFLVACATTEEIPPPKPTSTPIPPTATNTPTPTPTPTPTLMPMDEFIEQLDAEVIFQLLDQERNEYLLGYYRFAIGIATELIDTWLGDYPTIYRLRAESYWKLGDFDNAIKDMKKAAQLPPIDPDPTGASTLNTLCWYLAVSGDPEEALPYCEDAIQIDPDPMYLDSRGLAYALLGRNADAIADFEKVIEEFEGATDPFLVEVRESREQWVADLGAGKDLNTPEFLEELQAEEIDPNAFPEPELLQSEDYTQTHFSRIMKNEGFYNYGVEVNESGVEVDTHLFSFENDCSNIVFVVGPENETWMVNMVLWNCTEDQVIAETMWFLGLLFHQDGKADADSIEMGQGYAWVMKDVMDVFSGKVSETDWKVISGVIFTAEGVEDPDIGSGISVLAEMP